MSCVSEKRDEDTELKRKPFGSALTPKKLELTDVQ